MSKFNYGDLVVFVAQRRYPEGKGMVLTPIVGILRGLVQDDKYKIETLEHGIEFYGLDAVSLCYIRSIKEIATLDREAIQALITKEYEKNKDYYKDKIKEHNNGN